MAVRLTCTDNASGHDGLRWRMGPDSESVDIVVGETAPGVGELVVNDPIVPEACFSVVAYAGDDEGEPAVACAETGSAPIEIGDEWQGGIYAGVYEIESQSYHIIISPASANALRTWGPSGSDYGASSSIDGIANTNALLAASGDFPAAEYCAGYENDGYSDWYMPANGELSFIYAALAGSPVLDTLNVFIFSSTQSSSSSAFTIRFDTGALQSLGRSNSYNVRPIRRVPV